MPKVTFKSLYRNFSNHVHTEISGVFPEKFINICIKRGISVWNVEKTEKNTYRMIMSVKDFKHKIRSAALKTKCRVHVLSRGGAGIWLNRYKKRLPLLLGSIFLCVAVIFLFSLLWSVDIVSQNGADIVAANKILENMGIIPGVSLKSLDVKKISKALSSGIDGVEWAGVSIEGTKMTVTLSDGTYFEGAEISPDIPCDVVAAKDALIVKIVAEQGTVVAAEQSVVLAGETIISGTVVPINEILGNEERYTHARGSVTGIVRYSAYCFIENEAEMYELTGNTAEQKKLLIFGFKIPVPWCRIKNTYTHYDSITVSKYITIGEDTKLPLGVSTETLIEAAVVTKTFSDEEALSYARLQAMAELDDKIPGGADIVDTGSDIRTVDGREAVYVWAECAEEIGMTQRMDQ